MCLCISSCIDALAHVGACLFIGKSMKVECTCDTVRMFDGTLRGRQKTRGDGERLVGAVCGWGFSFTGSPRV